MMAHPQAAVPLVLGGVFMVAALRYDGSTVVLSSTVGERHGRAAAPRSSLWMCASLADVSDGVALAKGMSACVGARIAYVARGALSRMLVVRRTQETVTRSSGEGSGRRLLLRRPCGRSDTAALSGRHVFPDEDRSASEQADLDRTFRCAVFTPVMLGKDLVRPRPRSTAFARSNLRVRVRRQGPSTCTPSATGWSCSRAPCWLRHSGPGAPGRAVASQPAAFS